MNNMQIKKGRKPREKRFDSKFAEVLRHLLFKKEEAGVNLTAVADNLGITRQSLAQYRDGNNIPDIVILGRMADYFGVTTDYLLGRTEVKSADYDAQKFCESTGLSEVVFEYLCSKKSLLEIEMLNAFFEDNDREFFDFGYSMLRKYETYAFRKAAYIKFVKENNLPISGEMIKERGEYSLKGVFKGDKYFNLHMKLENFYLEWSKKLGMKNDLEDYNDFCLLKATRELAENTFVFFCGGSKIADYFDKYYEQLLVLSEQEDSKKIIELDIAKMDFLKNITDTKGAPVNGGNNPQEE